MYETKISDARWIAYDIPGNIGWIVYIVTVIIALINKPDIFSYCAIIPSVLILIGIVELISERIAKLDRILPKARLYRGFGALTAGGALGVIFSAVNGHQRRFGESHYHAVGSGNMLYLRRSAVHRL